MKYAITTTVDELKQYRLPAMKERFKSEKEAQLKAMECFRKTGRVHYVRPIKDFRDFYAPKDSVDVMQDVEMPSTALKGFNSDLITAVMHDPENEDLHTGGVLFLSLIFAILLATII